MGKNVLVKLTKNQNETSSHNSSSSSLFRQYLEDLENLSPMAKEWGEVSSFIESLQQLSEKKQLEKEKLEKERFEKNQYYKKIEEILGIFQNSKRELLEFQGLTEVLNWNRQVFLPAKVEEVLKSLSKVNQNLTEFENLNQLIKGIPPVEKKEIRKKQRALEDEIDQICVDINTNYLKKSSDSSLQKETSTVPESVERGDFENLKIVKTENSNKLETVKGEKRGEEKVKENTEDEKSKQESEANKKVKVEEKHQENKTEQYRKIEDFNFKIGLKQGKELKQDKEIKQEIEAEEADVNKKTEISVKESGINAEESGINAGEAEINAKEDRINAEEAEAKDVIEDKGAKKVKGKISSKPKKIEKDKENFLEESPSIKEIAKALKNNSVDENHWNFFLWALVNDNDIAGAYWLSRAMAIRHISPEVPASLLKAMQASQWITKNTDNYIKGFPEVIGEYDLNSEGRELSFLRLSAAILPSLLSPETGVATWLDTPSWAKDLEKITSYIKDFVERWGTKFKLRVDHFKEIPKQEQIKAEMKGVIDKICSWKDRIQVKAPREGERTIKYLMSGGKIISFLDIIVKNQKRDWRKVEDELKYWGDEHNISEQIRKAHYESTKIHCRSKSIGGALLRSMHRTVDEVVKLSKRWCDLVKFENEITSGNSGAFEKSLAKLKEQIKDLIPNIEVFIKEQRSSSNKLSTQAASLHLGNAIAELIVTFEIENSNFSQKENFSSWDWLQDSSNDLNLSLNQRLLLLPELRLSDDLTPPNSELQKLPEILRDSYLDERDLKRIYSLWMKNDDLRFIERVLGFIDDEKVYEQIENELLEYKNGNIESLRKYTEHVSDEIEQAVVDEIISQEERAEYTGIVESLEIEETLNFAKVNSDLKEVIDQLREATEKKINGQRKDWEEKYQSILESADLNPEEEEQIYKSVEKALEGKQNRVLEESFSVLRQLQLGNNINLSLFSDLNERGIFEVFLQAIPFLEELVQKKYYNNLKQIADDIRREKFEKFEGKIGQHLKIESLPSERRKETAEAILAWMKLKTLGKKKKGYAEPAKSILKFLGFSLGNPEKFLPEPSESDSYAIYFRVGMSDGGMSKPIPQFGSDSHEIYHVVCLWKDLEAASIGARLKRLNLAGNNVIVFYLGNLDIRQRNDIARMSRKQKFVFAILDETLLLFLAREQDVGLRIKTFFHCSLPYTALNPYIPAGEVPPEMFFGRADLIKELQNFRGSCIIYGGRQLGKSAILKHVQREFHDPKKEQYAWIDDLIKIPSDEDGYTNHIWETLREGSKKSGLIKKNITTNDPKKIIKNILEAIETKAHSNVLVMFDEADNFLNADAKNNFKIVNSLRELMEKTHRRFKVVFAGLHSVQRFQNIPNQPLVQFGTPQCIGPLEAYSAQQLVKRPLETLGYNFQDNSTVLQILSYTNYHPGLIQRLCKELLVQHHNERGKGDPPFTITRRDVDHAYRKIRHEIRDRFELTLKLDKRYQAIALAIIVEQISEEESFTQSFSEREILTLMQGWWPKGFSEIESYQMQSLLIEMHGLGVLVADEQGYYRLRSSNLVRLMGSSKNIEAQLLELSQSELPPPFNADSYHAPLSHKTIHYSPLTYSQEKSLFSSQNHTGIGAVFSTEALGYSFLPEMCKKFSTTSSNQEASQVIKVQKNDFSEISLKNYLGEQISFYEKCKQLIFYHEVSLDEVHKINQLIQDVENIFKKRKSSKKKFYFFFFFNQVASLEWFSQMNLTAQEKIENHLTAMIFPKLWNDEAISQRLSQHGKLDSSTICSKILEATGGWPFLLDELFKRVASIQDDLQPLAQEIKEELQDQDSDLWKHFYQSLQIDPTREEYFSVLKCMSEVISSQPDKEEDVQVFVTEELKISSKTYQCAYQYLSKMQYLNTHHNSKTGSRMVKVNPVIHTMLFSL